MSRAWEGLHHPHPLLLWLLLLLFLFVLIVAILKREVRGLLVHHEGLHEGEIGNIVTDRQYTFADR